MSFTQCLHDPYGGKSSRIEISSRNFAVVTIRHRLTAQCIFQRASVLYGLQKSLWSVKFILAYLWKATTPHSP